VERPCPKRTRPDKAKINLAAKQITDTNFTNFPGQKAPRTRINTDVKGKKSETVKDLIL